MKKDYIEVFKHNTDTLQYDKLVKGALQCLDEFGKCFKNEDLEGMDSCLHFPHYIISDNEVIVWNKSGNLPQTFFDDLKKNGFKRTIVTCREVITASENKVHFKYCYYRESIDGTIMSEHDNVWILTFKNGRWGIQVRSY